MMIFKGISGDAHRLFKVLFSHSSEEIDER
jgi:hypothetical protein